jgi:murein L,D-transpeptidase YcbB/YkuD
MRVNVGEDYNHQTPMFQGSIQYLVFRPYWTPPANILKNEIIPDMEKTPSLTDLNLELVSGTGKVINSGDVTPALLQQVRSGRLTVRQAPGPENGMGLVNSSSRTSTASISTTPPRAWICSPRQPKGKRES